MKERQQRVAIIRDNPIFWREAVPRALRNAHPRVRDVVIVAAAALSTFGGMAVASLPWREPGLLGIFLAVIWAAVTLMVVPSHAARAIVQERLQGTWDALVLTRLSPADIFLGKLFATLLPVWVIGFLFLPTCAMLAANEPFAHYRTSALANVALVYAAGTIGSLATAAVGLFVSARCASIWSAQLWTYLSMFALVGLSAVVMVGLDALL